MENIVFLLTLIALVAIIIIYKRIKRIGKKILNLEDSYTSVNWPEYQTYMDEEWFYKEAVYNPKENKYFIPNNRLWKS